MTTHTERRTRVNAITERTGKPHFFVDPGVGKRAPTWLFANHVSLKELPPEQANATWDFLDHLDEVYGYE